MAWRISKMVARNCGAYCGEETVRFARDAITVLSHQDNADRAAIPDAVRWCLYGESGWGSGTSCINDRYFESLPDGSAFKGKVDLYMDRDGAKYRISRRISGTKPVSSPVKSGKSGKGSPTGRMVIDFEEEVLFERIGGGRQDGRTFENNIDCMLPAQLACFSMPGAGFLRKLVSGADKRVDGALWRLAESAGGPCTREAAYMIGERLGKVTAGLFGTLSWRGVPAGRVTVGGCPALDICTGGGRSITLGLPAGDLYSLGLSFAAAVCAASGHGFPVMVDCPIGHLDPGTNRRIAAGIAGLFPGSQIILIVGRAEYGSCPEFRESLPARAELLMPDCTRPL